MTKILIGTTLAVFALAPALSSADCEYHNKASMASLKPAEAAAASQAPAASKAPAAVVAKAAATKPVVAKREAAPAKDASTVVAKNN